MKNNAAAIIAALVIGAAAGAAIALLYSPQPGAKTRKQLQHQVQDLKEWTDEFVKGVKEQDERICKAVKETADGYRREMLARFK